MRQLSVAATGETRSDRIAQVNGNRGPLHTSDRVALDLEYIRHWSLLLDLKILFMTCYVTLKGDG